MKAFSTDLHWEWLAGSSLKVTAWLLLVLAVLRLTRKTSAASRHLVAVCGAVGIPLIFLLNLSFVPNEFGWQPFAKGTVERVDVKIMSMPQYEAGNAPLGLANKTPANGTTIQSSGAFDSKSGIVALWWLGCIVVGIRFLLRLRAPRLSNSEDAPAELYAVLNRECERMNFRTVPTLRTIRDAMPMVYGIRQPAIVLPTAAIGWPSEKLTSVLRHELAHLRRRDVVWSMIVEAALLPLWWHPLARVLRRRTLEWTEQACDDAVINTGIAPTQYATDLLSLSRRSGAVPAHGFAALSEHGQQARFQRLLAEDINRETISSGKVTSTGLLALGLLIPTTLFVSCSTVPKDAPAQDIQAAIAPVVNIPPVAEVTNQIRLFVKVFEVDYPSDEELENPVLAEWLAGRTKLLSSAAGSDLFDIQRTGSDILSAPQVVTQPGRRAKLEIGSLVPLSGQEKPEFAKVGIEIDSVVWPTGKTNILKVDLTGSTREVVGYKSDESGFDVPQIRHLQGEYRGMLPNGSYLLIGQPMQPLLLRDKVPVLGDIPLLGRLFRSNKVEQERKVIAAQFSFSETP